MLISWREEEQIYEGLGMSDGELAEQATAWLRAQGDEGESEGSTIHDQERKSRERSVRQTNRQLHPPKALV
jgi:hypothetical protein